MDLRAVIFVPALTGSVVFGFLFGLYLAHHYLTALYSTAAGSRQVVWLSEPILDHFWKVFYLAWLVGLWLGPAWLLGRAYAGGAAPVWLKFAVPLAVFWLLYPVSQLSSLSAPTIWLPLAPGVFDRLARIPGVFAGFLALSVPVLALWGLAFYWVYLGDGIERLVGGSVLLVLAVLLYARLLGRLAFALSYTKMTHEPLPANRKRKTEADSGPSARTRTPVGESVEEPPSRFVQPSELPPIVTPDEGPLTGYDVRFEDDPPKPRPKRVVAEAVEPTTPAEPRRRSARRAADDDDTPYDARPPEVVIAEAVPEEVVKPSALELRLLSREDAPRKPKRVWSGELFEFLAQPETWGAVGMLSLMAFAAGGMVRIARTFNPVDGSG